MLYWKKESTKTPKQLEIAICQKGNQFMKSREKVEEGLIYNLIILIEIR